MWHCEAITTLERQSMDMFKSDRHETAFEHSELTVDAMGSRPATEKNMKPQSGEEISEPGDVDPNVSCHS